MTILPNGTDDANTSSNNVSNAMMATGAEKDGGSCCNTTTSGFATSYIIPVNGNVGATTAFSTTATTSATAIVGQACVAFKAATTGAASTSSATDGKGTAPTGIDDVSTKFTSWWCSNGLYKKVTAAGDWTVN